MAGDDLELLGELYLHEREWDGLIKNDDAMLTASGTSTRIPRLETLCRSSWITFVTENANGEDRAAKLSRVIETHILKRWGSYFIDKITVPEIDAGFGI